MPSAAHRDARLREQFFGQALSASQRTGVRLALGLGLAIQAQNSKPNRIQLVQPPDLTIRREQRR